MENESDARANIVELSEYVYQRTRSRLAGLARGATIDLINVAARLACHGRDRLTLHLPDGWRRQAEWMNLFHAGCGPPRIRAA